MSVLELIAGYRARAAAVLDPVADTYFSCGSGEEITLGEAERAWRDWRLRPRVLRDVSVVQVTTRLFDTPMAAPVMVAPTGYLSMAHPDGELAVAEGAAAAGIPLVLSSRSTRPMGAVAKRVPDWWFQVYLLRDRAATARMVERAVAAGAKALVLTVDTPFPAAKARLAGELPVSEADTMANFDSVPTSVEQEPGLVPADVAWLRDLGGLPVLVKGVLRADDAVASVAAGAAGVIVSTHGGRQLDRAQATAYALPEVVAAVGETVPVLVDGGIRTGIDVLVALALGAKAVLVGRPVVWALAAAGPAGVAALLDAYREEFADAMALAGAPRLADLTRDLVVPAGGQLGRPEVPSAGGVAGRAAGRADASPG
ncbi:MAG: alpha-hydroxy acid oxidase [Mycobacteriales bacterium]